MSEEVTHKILDRCQFRYFSIMHTLCDQVSFFNKSDKLLSAKEARKLCWRKK